MDLFLFTYFTNRDPIILKTLGMHECVFLVANNKKIKIIDSLPLPAHLLQVLAERKLKY